MFIATLTRANALSFKKDRARFASRRRLLGSSAAWFGFKMSNYLAGQADIAASAGDLEKGARLRKEAEATRTISVSLGPPVPIASKRPGLNGRTGQAFGMFESMIPPLPSAGIQVEF